MYKLHLDPKFLKTYDIYEAIGNLNTRYFRYLMLRNYIVTKNLDACLRARIFSHV